MRQSASPLEGKTTDWRAGCGRSASPVRREGGPGQPALPTPIPQHGAAMDGRNKMLWEWAAAALIILLVVQNPSIGEIR
jgi:hypothetical protein